MDLDDEELKATRELNRLKNVDKIDEQRRIELKMYLLELEKLAVKYKFAIGGCGCCSSPYILDLTTDEKYPDRIADDLSYDIENKKYYICE